MALHKLVVEVVDGGKVYGGGAIGDTKDATSEKTKKKTPLQKFLNYKQTIKDKVKGSGDNKMSANTYMAISSGVGLVKQGAKSVFNYYVSDIGRKNGDSNHQAQINRKIEQVTDVTSIVGAGLSGAAAGSMVGGPIGAAIGAVVGVAGASISNAFKYAERERSFAHEMFKQNNSQSYNLARANYSALTGRVR